MTRKRKSGTAVRGVLFLDRLREALSRYADGVHALSAPASAAALEGARARLGASLPPSLSELYQLSDGLWLFDDTVRVSPLAELHLVEGRIAFGTAERELMLCDEQGRVFTEDEDGDRILVAVDAEEALLVWLAREGLLIEADGEFKEVFDPTGELLPAVQRKRNEAARKRAPLGARWALEAAELALEQGGKEGEADRWLRAAIDADAGAPAPQEILGSLLIARGLVEEGAQALARAAEVGGPARRGERAAAAAAAARRAGDEGTRARMAEVARATEPEMAARLVTEAEAALAAGRLDDADHLSGLATALAGDEVLSPRLRMRGRLRPLGG